MKKNNKQKKLPIFAERFNELRGEMSQDDFSKKIGISRPTVGFYENGDRLPDALTLKQIADRCGVSTDWLVGKTDARTTDATLRAVCDCTGLSEDAVNILINDPFVKRFERDAQIDIPYRVAWVDIINYIAAPMEGDLGWWQRRIGIRREVYEIQEALFHLFESMERAEYKRNLRKSAPDEYKILSKSEGEEFDYLKERAAKIGASIITSIEYNEMKYRSIAGSFRGLMIDYLIDTIRTRKDNSINADDLTVGDDYGEE